MHDLTLFDMPRLLAAVERDVRAARRGILVEAYIVRDDRLGLTLARWLVAAAARGVDVRLLYDSHGSIEADQWIFAWLSRRGVWVRPYSRIGKALGHLSPVVRNHSRMLVVDGAAYTGGYAWADPWLPAERGGGGWHDLACRAVGPVVDDFVALFEQRWREADGAAILGFDSGGRHADVRLVSQGPGNTQGVLESLLAAFAGARGRIWWENAYFFPTTRVLRALADAAARGVDVRVLLPAHSDLPIVGRAAHAEYEQWLAAGLRIWEYLPTVLHGKAALIDDDWCTISTYNANPTATHFSIELALIVRQPRFIGALAAQIEHDMHRCREVTRQTLTRRPLLAGTLDELAYVLMSLSDRLLEP